MGRIAGRFARVEPRLRAGRLVLGLLSDLPRKNCWTIAEWAGEAAPHGMQHLLSRTVWDADAVRDDVREYVIEQLRDEAAVLVVDPRWLIVVHPLEGQHEPAVGVECGPALPERPPRIRLVHYAAEKRLVEPGQPNDIGTVQHHALQLGDHAGQRLTAPDHDLQLEY